MNEPPQAPEALKPLGKIQPLSDLGPFLPPPKRMSSLPPKLHHAGLSVSPSPTVRKSFETSTPPSTAGFSLPLMRRNSQTARGTPKLEQGGGPGFAPTPGRASSPSRRRNKGAAVDAAGLPARIAILVYRMAKTPRGLAVLFVGSLVWFVSSAVSHGHHKKLMAKQVPASLLPLIRHSGNLIHHVSPVAGSRIKAYHDEQLAKSGHRQLSPDELAALSAHTFHPNGLILVNPKGPHPIHALIDRAEKS